MAFLNRTSPVALSVCKTTRLKPKHDVIIMTYSQHQPALYALLGYLDALGFDDWSLVDAVSTQPVAFCHFAPKVWNMSFWKFPAFPLLIRPNETTGTAGCQKPTVCGWRRKKIRILKQKWFAMGWLPVFRFFLPTIPVPPLEMQICSWSV